MTQRRIALGSVVLFLLLLSVYLKGLAPTITPGDSPELVSAAYNMGIAHPSGYPLYLQSGRIFARLPLGEIAFRLNLFNALVVALNASLLPLVICLFVKRSSSVSLIGLSLGLFWGLIYPVAGQGLISEVYPLFWLCLNLTLLALGQRNYYLAALMVGLGLNGHYAFLLAVPGLLFLVKKPFWQAKGLLFVVGFVFLGLALILYMPLRAVQKPIPAWGQPTNYQRLSVKLTLKEFGERPEIRRGKDFANNLIQLSYLIKIIFTVFGILLAIMLVGYLLLFRENKYLAWGLSVILLVFILGLSRLGGYPNFAEAANLAPKFLVPLFIVFLIPICRGFLVLIDWCPKRFQMLCVLIIITIGPALAFRQRPARQRWNFLAYDYGLNLLNSLPAPGFYLATSGDASSFPLAYLKYVANYLPDQEVTGTANFPTLKRRGQKPLYTTMQVDEDNQPYPAYRLFFAAKDLNLPPQWPPFYRLRGVNQTEKFTDMMSRFTQSKYYFFRGIYYLQKGGIERGLQDFSLASRLSSSIAGEHYNYGMLLKTHGQLAEAANEFRFFLSGFSHVLPGYYQLGKIYEKLGQSTKAIDVFNELYQRNPRFTDTAYRLGRLYVKKGEYQKAISPLQTAQAIQPSADIFNLLGVAYEEVNQLQLAASHYKKALSLNPKVAGFYYNYARLLEKMGHPDYQPVYEKYRELERQRSKNKRNYVEDNER